MHVCTQCIDGNGQFKRGPNEEPIEYGEASLSTIQLTERQSTRDAVQNTEAFSVEQTKDAYCRRATT